MKLKLMNGEFTARFKLKEIVTHAVSKMPVLTDYENMTPNLSTEEFAEECLQVIDKMYSNSQEVNKQTISNWNRWKKSVSIPWHNLKSENLNLRTAYIYGKGFIRCKTSMETPKPALEMIDEQGSERIIPQMKKQNARVKHDEKLTGEPMPG